MNKLLNSLSSDNLVLLCVIMGVLALCLAVAISIEIYINDKKYKKMNSLNNDDVDEFKDFEIPETKLNIKESSDIKYVEEDSELEKTKAKIELANLREKLRKEEEEKQKLLELNMALSQNVKDNNKIIESLYEEKPKVEKKEKVELQVDEVKEEQKENIETKEEVVEEPIKDETIQEVVKEEKTDNPSIVENNTEQDDLIDIGEDNLVSEVKTNESYPPDEEDAIISYEELKNAQSFGYTDDEMNRYVDEQDAIISIQELEKLYLESQSIDASQKEETSNIEFEMKRVEDLPEIADSNKFQSSPLISPVYGMAKTEKELILEQTANLEKLNEEIKKTNEFLKTLKDLKKNLE